MVKIKLVDLILAVSENGKRIAYALPDKLEITIGRGKDNDLLLSDPLNTISRHHCTIYNNGEEVRIVDNKSRNGTLINQVQAKPGESYILSNGDKLRLGFYDLEVKIEED